MLEREVTSAEARFASLGPTGASTSARPFGRLLRYAIVVVLRRQAPVATGRDGSAHHSLHEPA